MDENDINKLKYNVCLNDGLIEVNHIIRSVRDEIIHIVRGFVQKWLREKYNYM